MNRLLLLAWILSLGFFNLPLARASITRPKLIVMIVFDQFRADYLMRFENRFLPTKSKNGTLGGFSYLMNEGAYFPYGQYEILQSMTCPGHATILTGSYPYRNGIPLNDWVEPSGKSVYCVADPEQPIVGGSPNGLGISPIHLLAPTVGDSLKDAGYPSRVVSISLKDRAAVMLGGHRADLALWYDPKNQSWVSSRFYLPDGKLPEWVTRLNQENKGVLNKEYVWEAHGSGTGFSMTEPTVLARGEHNGKASDRFPHRVISGTYESLMTPLGGDLLEAAAENAVEAYRLGKGGKTDLLAVSFSGHDYAGHVYGPNSREMEELTVAEDASISKLLNYLQKHVPGGLKNVLISLTGDHGIPPNIEQMKAGHVDAGRIPLRELKAEIESHLEKKFGKTSHRWTEEIDGDWFIDRAAAQDKGISISTIENEAKAVMMKSPGVAQVITSDQYDTRNLPAGVLERQTLLSYFPGRSGDLILVPKPNYITDKDTDDHFTGYNYDRYVPIIFAGSGIRRGIYSTEAKVVDIAPTLSFLGGIIPPASSEGRVLSEALATSHAR